MGFLDRPVSELSLGELQRLIRQEVGHQIPPIPAWVAALSDLDKPLIPPDWPTNAFTLVYSTAQGKYIDSQLPTTSVGTDATSPGQPVVTLISGPGWLQAKWAAVTGSSDPIQYKVYARSGSAPTTADATYLVGTTTALSFVFSKLADGTATTDTGTYHVIVKPVSSLTGGATGTDSVDVSGSPAALDGSVFTISNINAGNITTGTLAVGGAVTVTGTITGATIRTAASGQRVQLDVDGIHLYDASTPAALLVDIPTDSTKTAYFGGNVSAASLTMNGTANSIAYGGKLQLAGGVSQPLTVAALASDTTVGTLTAVQYYVAYSWAKEDSTGVYTVTSASPAVFTLAAHGYKVNDPVYFTTSNVIPSGLVANQIYYVISTGLTTNNFEISATRGGSAINTASTGTGTQTVHHYKETQPSPVTSILGVLNKSIRITMPAAPTGATLAFVYMNTATFGAGGGHFQATTSPVTISNTVSTTIVQSAYSAVAAVSATVNTFQNVGSGGAVTGGAQIYPGFPTDTAGNDYSWRIEGNGRIRIYGPTLNVQYSHYEEFLGQAAKYTGTGSDFVEAVTGGVSGAGVTAGTSSNVNPGVINLNTGTTTTGADALRMALSIITPGVARIRYTAYFNVSSPPNSTDKYQIVLGLSDTVDASVAATTAHLIAFTFVSTNDSGVFGLRCTNAGSATTFTQAVDASGANVTLTANVYHLADFEINPAGTSVAWWLDGVPQTAIATNIPTAAMTVVCGISKTAGTTTRALRMDAQAIYGDFVS